MVDVIQNYFILVSNMTREYQKYFWPLDIRLFL